MTTLNLFIRSGIGPLLLVLLCTLSRPVSAQVPGAQEDQPDRDIADDQGQETFLDKTGIFLDATTGGSFRTNHFASDQPLLDSTAVDYASLNVGVLTASIDMGVLGASVLDFEYQTPYPKTDFQREALNVHEDRSHGLEKYTFGVDTTPLWRLLLPDGTPKILVYLPSFKVRYRQELTQNTATLGKNALYLVPPGTNDYDRTVNGIRFQDVPAGRTFSFRTKYRYGSLTWPAYVTYEDSTRAYKEVRFGAAAWTYTRMYVTKFPQVSPTRPVVYEARTDAVALQLNASYLKRSGVRVRARLGLGIGDFQSEAHEESLDTLFEPAGAPDTSAVQVESSNVKSGQIEGSISYRLSLLPGTSAVNLHLEPGISLDYFWSQFDVFDEETLQDEEASNEFRQGDLIFLPWIRLSLSVN